MVRCTIGIIILACLFMLSCAKAPESVLPVSREASIIESTNPAEVMIEASGIGSTTDSALLDARRSAVAVVLSGGTDPLLQTPEERMKFQSIQEYIYSVPTINQFISWESSEVKNRLKLEGGKKVKLTKSFKVNKKMLGEELVSQGIIQEREEIATTIGKPMIMVIPEVPKGENPIDTLYSDAALRHAAQSIESYLTNRLYDVVVPEQSTTVDGLVEAQQAIKGMEEDMGYQLALVIGSDVYITYTVDIQSRDVGGSIVRKAIVGVRAYETTTARLLGTETGYSEERPTADLVVVEEAIHGAIDNVLSRVDAYWKKDLTSGVQYKLVVNIDTAESSFDADEREDIAFAMSDALKQNTKSFKENVASDLTMDYLVWVDPEQIGSSRDLYGALRRDFPMGFRRGKLSSVNITRKLIILKVTEAGN